MDRIDQDALFAFGMQSLALGVSKVGSYYIVVNKMASSHCHINLFLMLRR